MAETRATTPAFPPGRYGRRRDGRRRVAGPVLAFVLVLAASVALSVRLYQQYGGTDYDPQIVGWSAATDTAVTIRFTVRVPPGGAASCVLRARDFGGNELGRRTVVVRAARGDREIRAAGEVPTKARAVVGEVLSCRPAA
jgi:Domain of unknown function (DUF4307)